MAEKFNLLPKKQSRPARETKLTKLVKKAAIGSFILTVLLLGGGTTTLFLLKTNLNKIDQKSETTKNKISSLESAEMGLVVSKDRAQKIQKLLDLRRNERVYRKYMTLANNLPETIELTQVELSDTSTQATFVGTNSKEFSDFLDEFVLGQADYNVIYFDSVGLGRSVGYSLVLEVE